MIGILRDQQMGQQSRPSEAAVDRTRWRGGLHDPVASGATQLGTNVADDLKACTHVLQHLSNVFAQCFELAATVWARCMIRHVGVHFTGQVLGKRATGRLLRNLVPLRCCSRQTLLDVGCFQLF